MNGAIPGEDGREAAGQFGEGEDSEKGTNLNADFEG